MLIEFSVENFLSIGDRVTLSMVPFMSYKEFLDTNTHISESVRANRILTSAIIYGPNASGKTNIFKAINYMSAFIRSSADEKSEDILNDLSVFGLDPKFNEQPTRFSISFLFQEFIYHYCFSIKENLINYEELSIKENKPRQKWSVLYVRDLDSKQEIWYGPKLKGDRVGIYKKTRPNTLYLSSLYRWNSPIVAEPYEWFEQHLNSTPDNAPGMYPFTIHRVSESEVFKKKVLDFIQNADIDIEDIEIRRSVVEGLDLKLKDGAAVVLSNELLIQRDQKETYSLETKFIHSAEGEEGNKHFLTVDFNNESEGTQKLFRISGMIIDALEDGDTLLIDELAGNLHPLLTKSIVKLFHDPQINRKGAQLIFNTHDISLMDPTLYRRDQIWFTDKKKSCMTELFPLIDFKPKKEEAIRSRYLAGQYDAIPIIYHRFMVRASKTSNDEE
ncbi:MAG: ATP-binding protein [Candidatus Electryonea clarkiae]|nr:ATP-binding protein [Candidatus Electryonea clarkiae]MDP8289022.1 ATP-binding protein [Candidatus Electryonea clarkiae]